MQFLQALLKLPLPPEVERVFSFGDCPRRLPLPLLDQFGQLWTTGLTPRLNMIGAISGFHRRTPCIASLSNRRQLDVEHGCQDRPLDLHLTLTEFNTRSFEPFATLL